MARILSAVLSHPGLRRGENEDSYCSRPDLGLFMVADGMGGHAAGEIASKMAVEAVEEFVAETKGGDTDRTWPFPYDTTISMEGNRIKAALRLANRRLGAAMDGNEALRGMATTAAAVLFGGPTPVIAHVGDSRIYHWRQGHLRQITQDHSWVSEQVRAGVMTEADARRHPWRNVVTRAIAGGEELEVDVAEIDIAPGDRLMICSDGLCGVILPEKLEAIVNRAAALDETCRVLVDAANEAGGPDNITVAMLAVDVE